MKIPRWNYFVFAICILFVAQAKALIEVGSSPIDSIELRGCPEGSAVVADLKSSVGYWEGPPFGGGEFHVFYRGNADALNETLTNFAAIHAPELDLVIHDGIGQDQFLQSVNLHDGKFVQGSKQFDWSFVVWNPKNWNNLYNSTNAALTKIFKDSPVASNLGKPVPAPQLIAYIGDGQINWDEVKVPANVHVRDERLKK